MPTGRDLAGSSARIMILGYPGAGKTGCLAALANKGFKIRMLDFDGNPEPLILNTKDEYLDNIEIVSFEDQLRMGKDWLEPQGRPTAFSGAVRMMDHWKYKYNDEEIDLGYPKDWGADTIVVLDSLTEMGKAAFRYVTAMNNRTVGNVRRQDWGTAMNQQDEFIEKLTSPRYKFHTIVLSHLKIIGPKDIEKDDKPLSTELKERIADIVQTRLFPSALGHNLPPEIGRHFPTMLLCESQSTGIKEQRVITSVPRPELDLKLPGTLADKKPLPIETGMVNIFRSLKIKMPNEEEID